MSEQYEPITAIAQRITGKRPSRPTIWRWVQKGVNGGVKLAAVPVFGCWQCTEQSFREFLRSRTESALNRNRDSEPQADDDALRAVGLL